MVRLQITSDRNDIIPVIQDAIAAKMKRTEIGFRRTEQEIHRFEKKYNRPLAKVGIAPLILLYKN